MARGANVAISILQARSLFSFPMLTPLSPPSPFSLLCRVAQVFFLYFTLFHVYFFSFPFGFSYLALVTTVLFLQHSMLFCWNRYEASVAV